MPGYQASDNALGFRAVRLHYSADDDKNPHHPDPELAEKALQWYEDAKRKYPDPNQWAQEMEINWWVSQGTRVYPEFQEHLHTLQISGIRPRKVIYRTWDFGWHCYTLDHEICTANGWKPIAEVPVGEEVLTLNPVTSEVEVQSVQAVTKYHHDGPMYRWHHRGLDLEVTPQHKIWYQLPGRIAGIPAELAPRRLVTPTGKVHHGKSIGAARAVLFGLYLSEGSTSSTRSRPTGQLQGRHYNIWIWQNHQDPWMDEWLKKTEYKWKYYRDKRGGRGWCTASKGLYEELARFGHARDKLVPDEVKQAPADEIALFLEAYRRGDGTLSQWHGARRPRESIHTGSRRMADDLQECYARIGVMASLRESRSGYSDKPIWVVSPRTPAGLSHRNLTVRHRSCGVACVTVPNGIVLVRRKSSNMPIWCGNSPACLIAQIDTRDRLIILKEVVGHQATTREFAQTVIERCARWFGPHTPGYQDFCDPAGQTPSPTSNERSEVRDVEVLNKLGIFPSWEYGWSRKDGRSLVHQLLALRTDQTPSLYLNAADCPVLFQGFLGKYVYAPKKNGAVHDEPDELNHPWADVMACLRYLATGLYSALGLRRGQSPQMAVSATPAYMGYGTPLHANRKGRKQGIGKMAMDGSRQSLRGEPW